jgi:hypothetical protein
MRKLVWRTVVVAVLACAVLLAWRFVRIPELPPRPQADMATVKEDLLKFARAERAFYASAGRYAAMNELRTEGLLSLPPETRWPYSYFVVMPGAKRFVVVAMGQGVMGARPLALAVDEKLDMRELEGRDFPPPHGKQRLRIMKIT